MKIIIFITFIIYSKTLFAHCDHPDILAIDSPKSLEKVNPSNIAATAYDPILNNANVSAYMAHSKNSGNFGFGAFDYELLIFDKVKDDNIKLCAFIARGQLHETKKVAYTLAGMNSNLKADHYFELCPEKEIDKEYPYYDNVCNFWIKPDEVVVFDESKKNKGTRGAHGNTFVYSTAKLKFKNNDTILECLGFGTLFNAIWSSYFKDLVRGAICTSEKNYFDKKKIKKIAESIGIYGIAKPKKKLRLEFHN